MTCDPGNLGCSPRFFADAEHYVRRARSGCVSHGQDILDEFGLAIGVQQVILVGFEIEIV